MDKKKVLNKQILKKWWFWVAVVVALGLIGSAAPDTQQTANNTQNATPTAPREKAQAYSYAGQSYEIVKTNYNVGVTGLNEYYVLTQPFDYTNDGFKAQVKAILTDIAHKKATQKFMAYIVTNQESIDSKADPNFILEKGADYYKSVINPKNETAYVASYTGGFDYDKTEKSDADSAFTILWFGSAVKSNPTVGQYVGTEQWKPAL